MDCLDQSGQLLKEQNERRPVFVGRSQSVIVAAPKLASGKWKVHARFVFHHAAIHHSLLNAHAISIGYVLMRERNQFYHISNVRERGFGVHVLLCPSFCDVP